MANKAAAYDLQLKADNFGVEFNDHYLGTNDDGTFTVTVFASGAELDALAAAGYQIGRRSRARRAQRPSSPR